MQCIQQREMNVSKVSKGTGLKTRISQSFNIRKVNFQRCALTTVFRDAISNEAHFTYFAKWSTSIAVNQVANLHCEYVFWAFWTLMGVRTLLRLRSMIFNLLESSWRPPCSRQSLLCLSSCWDCSVWRGICTTSFLSLWSWPQSVRVQRQDARLSWRRSSWCSVRGRGVVVKCALCSAHGSSSSSCVCHTLRIRGPHFGAFVACTASLDCDYSIVHHCHDLELILVHYSRVVRSQRECV